MTGWNVYLDGELIDTVFYDSDCDEDYVRRGLINHDGYDPSIAISSEDEEAKETRVCTKCRKPECICK